jgi:hypothetical protein
MQKSSAAAFHYKDSDHLGGKKGDMHVKNSIANIDSRALDQTKLRLHTNAFVVLIPSQSPIEKSLIIQVLAILSA